MYEFRKCVNRYNGNYHTSSFTCMDQFLCMVFAQLTYRESFAILRSVFVHVKRSFIISAFEVGYLAAHLPTRMKNVTGEYTPTFVKS